MILLLIVLSVLPDPAGVTVAIENSPRGLLITDGRGRGLFLCKPDGDMEIISVEPGAGRNVISSENGLLFKECPFEQYQRVIRREWSGECEVIYSGEYFSGPFRFDGDSYLVAEPGRALRIDRNGTVLESWAIEGYPASAAVSGFNLFYTGESGGLLALDLVSGENLHLETAECIIFG